MNVGALAYKHLPRRRFPAPMHQPTVPQLRFKLDEELPLRPHQRENFLTLLAALLLAVGENEVVDEER